MKRSLLSCLALASLIFTGCASRYFPPGHKADLQAFAPVSIQESFATKPTHPFPAGIAMVRVQAPSYSNYHLRETGRTPGEAGRYSVIMTKEVEAQSDLDRITALPQVSGLTTLNRLLLPEKLESDRELREAAARLHADLVLVYTFDTAFFDTDAAKPLSVITLGLSPTRKIVATTTVSALLMDTRTGYIYSTYDATERATTLSTSWGSGDSADKVRRETEGRAFGKLVNELVASWPTLLAKAGR